MQNLSAKVCGINDLQVSEYPEGDRPLKAKEVRVSMKRVGICGSDVHYLKHGRIADFVVQAPMVIGHESAGVVMEVGPEVSTLQVGDRVALEPGIACLTCSHCLTGRYNLCPQMKFFATPPIHGSLCHRLVHPAHLCHKLPDELTLEEGAMCEPLSVAVHACVRAGVTANHRIAILGAGPIGLCMLIVTRAYGPCDVVLTDVSDSRLSIAQTLGASGVLNVKGMTPEESTTAIIEQLGGQPDVVFDCCGFEHSMATALHVTKSGGKVCLIGMGCDCMSLKLTSASCREVDIVGIFRYCNTYPACMALLASGRIDVKPLITHRIDLQSSFDADKIREGFATAATPNAIKVMFQL
eukprot:c3296_g1_i1.p1 GENE.c3296_g1_i1~~c3296_g1_i1.p1  ORF type:complete len:363 (+),score=85.10 c3296_g1_i1:32-1090(+)